MVASLSRFLGSLRLATIGGVVVAAHMIVPLLVPGVAAGTNGPIVVFGGQQYAVSVGADAFESAAYDPVNGRFASRDFLYDACGQAVSAGPEEGPGLAWDAATGYFWQITNDRVVRRWNGGTIVDTVFAIPPTFLVPVSGPDTLEAPKGIALDDDHVYVVDAGPEPGRRGRTRGSSSRVRGRR